LLLFRNLVEKLMVAWRFNKFSELHEPERPLRVDTFRHCTLTYRQSNPFHFFTPRSLRHFIYCNTNLPVDSVQLWSHGDYPWCLTVAAAYGLWPLFLESKSPRIFTVSALMIPHFTLWWNFWNPKSLQQFAGNIGVWIFHIISAVWPRETGDLRWSHLLLCVIESAWERNLVDIIIVLFWNSDRVISNYEKFDIHTPYYLVGVLD
jgi:hypothetical protein